MWYNCKDIENALQSTGFMPFFRNEIDGFSIEENISPDYWFPEGDGEEGVWEWKNDIIVEADCAYGKLLGGKACFVSMQWYPDLVNYRRSIYHPEGDRALLLGTVREHGSLLSRELKKLCGYTATRQRTATTAIERIALKTEGQQASSRRAAPQRKGFDTAITWLQMGCWLVSGGFEYNYTRDGRRYGWSVARYCTPEEFFGAERINISRTPLESKNRIIEHLRHALPQATEAQISKIIS